MDSFDNNIQEMMDFLESNNSIPSPTIDPNFFDFENFDNIFESSSPFIDYIIPSGYNPSLVTLESSIEDINSISTNLGRPRSKTLVHFLFGPLSRDENNVIGILETSMIQNEKR